jgi:hypothetical protein
MFPHDSTHADPALAVPAALRSRLQQVAETLAQITADIKRATHIDMPIILAEHRATFYQAMESLGNGILAFLAEEPRPDEVQAVREQIVRQVREWSSTSPLIRHSLGKPRGQSSDPELVKRLMRGRPAGADIPSLILNDFYMHSVGGLAYRGRVGLLVKAMQQSVSRHAAAGADPVRVLSLHVSGAGEILSLAQDKTFAEVAEVTCIDSRPTALRDVRNSLEDQLQRRCSFVHADALHYAERPDRPRHPYHVIYGVSIFEHLETNSASRLARDCHTLLAPGAILLAGSITPSVPACEQILRAWLTDWDLQYRDETTWRQVFARSGFDANALRFEYEWYKANVIVSAERDGRK